jgi:hypothetical protein
MVRDPALREATARRDACSLDDVCAQVEPNGSYFTSVIANGGAAIHTYKIGQIHALIITIYVVRALAQARQKYSQANDKMHSGVNMHTVIRVIAEMIEMVDVSVGEAILSVEVYVRTRTLVRFVAQTEIKV